MAGFGVLDQALIPSVRRTNPDRLDAGSTEVGLTIKS